MFHGLALSLGYLYIQKRWPSDKANHEKFAINYCISFKESVKVFNKVTSWPQLILKLLVAPACLHVASDWLHTFVTPKVFLLSVSLFFVHKYHYFVEA